MDESIEGLSFQYDESLEQTDLTTFKEGFEKLLNFIVKQVTPFVGTKKIFNRDIIKKIIVDESSEDAFTAKISLNKSRAGNMQINLLLKSPSGIWCFIWKKEYETIENVNSDIVYILENIYKINTIQEEK